MTSGAQPRTRKEPKLVYKGREVNPKLVRPGLESYMMDRCVAKMGCSGSSIGKND